MVQTYRLVEDQFGAPSVRLPRMPFDPRPVRMVIFPRTTHVEDAEAVRFDFGVNGGSPLARQSTFEISADGAYTWITNPLNNNEEVVPVPAPPYTESQYLDAWGVALALHQAKAQVLTGANVERYIHWVRLGPGSGDARNVWSQTQEVIVVSRSIVLADEVEPELLNLTSNEVLFSSNLLTSGPGFGFGRRLHIAGPRRGVVRGDPTPPEGIRWQ